MIIEQSMRRLPIQTGVRTLQNSPALNGFHLPYLEEPERDFAIFRELEVFSQDTIFASDGARLAIFEAGDQTKPTILLVNALGVSCLFFSKLAKVLARDYHVLTWESRGLPNFSAAAGNLDLSVERHCRDAAQVLARTGRDAEAVVAYCSGANIATHAIANRTIVTKRLCIISPSMEIRTVTAKTDYQRTMLPIWTKVSQSGPRSAAMVRALIQQNQAQHDGSIASELHHLNNLPFRTDDSTYRYAQLQAACLKFDWVDLLGQLKNPTLVLHGAEDDLIHEETSAAVAASVADASFQAIPGCGHFAVYTSTTLHDLVFSFLSGREDYGTGGMKECR